MRCLWFALRFILNLVRKGVWQHFAVKSSDPPDSSSLICSVIGASPERQVALELGCTQHGFPKPANGLLPYPAPTASIFMVFGSWVFVGTWVMAWGFLIGLWSLPMVAQQFKSCRHLLCRYSTPQGYRSMVWSRAHHHKDRFFRVGGRLAPGSWGFGAALNPHLLVHTVVTFQLGRSTQTVSRCQGVSKKMMMMMMIMMMMMMMMMIMMMIMSMLMFKMMIDHQNQHYDHHHHHHHQHQHEYHHFT